jgi:tetratricopeptide (TPR) repeat protein
MEDGMKYILLVTSAAALMGASPLPSGAIVSTIGGTSATSCYHAALARDASDYAFGQCDTAILGDGMPFDDLVATYVNRGVLKLVRNNYHGAEADFDKAMSLQSTQPEAWLNKGFSRYAQGDYRSARDMFSRALELKTSYAPLAYFGRALADEDVGDIRSAYADYLKASALDPKWAAPKEQLKRFKVVPKNSA